MIKDGAVCYDELTETHYSSLLRCDSSYQSLHKNHLYCAHAIIYSPTNMATNLYLENLWMDPWNDFVAADFLTFFLKSDMEVPNLSLKTITESVFRDNFYSGMKLCKHVNRGRPSVSSFSDSLSVKHFDLHRRYKWSFNICWAAAERCWDRMARTPGGCLSLQTSNKHCCFRWNLKWGRKAGARKPEVDWWLKDGKFWTAQGNRFSAFSLWPS